MMTPGEKAVWAAAYVDALNQLGMKSDAHPTTIRLAAVQHASEVVRGLRSLEPIVVQEGSALACELYQHMTRNLR